MHRILYLASASPSRTSLLSQAGISHTPIAHNADERAVEGRGSLQERVAAIACCKMEKACVPLGAATYSCYCVMTADTMVERPDGVVCGKPETYEAAVATLERLSGAVSVATALCCRAYRPRDDGGVVCVKEESCVTTTVCHVDMPRQWIARYLAAVPHALYVAGGLCIEGYGAQFIESVEGSYTGVLGLPLCHTRRALERVGFL